MTENVTDLFDRYRLCLREIWNTYFWQHAEFRTWDSVDVFRRLKPNIFQALVLEVLECTSPNFLVVPKIPDNSGNLLATHVVVTKPDAGGRSWAEELQTLRSSDATLHYVDVFEWSMMRYVDFPHYVAHISAFATRPDLVGREVLIDVHQVEILVEWAEAKKAPE